MRREARCEAPPVPSTARSRLPVGEHGAQEAVADRAADRVSGDLFLGADEGAAADAQHLTGETVRAGRGEERDGLADVAGLAALPERRQATRDLADGDRNRRRHAGLDEAGRDGVHGDAALGDLGREAAHVADDAALGGGVVGLTVVARDARDGRQADDAAAVAQHAVRAAPR